MPTVMRSEAASPGVDGRTDVRRAWVGALRADGRIAHALDVRLLRDCSMSLAEFEMLFRLASAEGQRLRLGQLRSVLLSRASSVTRYAARLEARGWLRRERPPEDRRSVVAVLEPAGRRALRGSSTAWAEELARSMADVLTPHQLDALRTALGRLLDAHADRLAERFGRSREPAEAGRVAELISWLVEAADGRLALSVGETWIDFIRAMAVTGDALDAALRAAVDLPATDFDVLAYLARGGPSRMGDLASGLYLPASTATRVAERFTRQGWTIRDRDEHDRRTVRLALTPTGTAVFDAAQGPWESALAEHVGAHLRPVDVRALATAAQVLNAVTT